MSIIQIFLTKTFIPSSGINATGGNAVDVSAGPSGILRKRHIFTGPGTFTVNSAPPTAVIDYILVGGGGGGGTDNASPATFGYSGAGGGAGQFRFGISFPITPGNYSVTIGAGGAGGTPSSPYGANGTSSTFGPITSVGGGGGAGLPPSYLNPGGYVGNPGGSGGGSRRYPTYYIPLIPPSNNTVVPGGSPVDTNYGRNGGGIPASVFVTPQPPATSVHIYNSGFNGSGGGGARNTGPAPIPGPGNAPGRSPDNSLSSRGGDAAIVPSNYCPINYGGAPPFGNPASATFFAAGGSGGLAQPAPGWSGPAAGPFPPTQGGGGSQNPLHPTGIPAVVNTGSGGGGYGGTVPGSNGGAGGPGILVISYIW